MIEDDQYFAALLQQELRTDPEFEIIKQIGSFTEGQEYIRTTHMQGVDCVLLDLQLPTSEGDRQVNSLAGLHLLDEMRKGEHYYGTVIVLTSSKSQSDGERALAGGCDGYLCKRAKVAEIPVLMAELSMAIKGDVIVVASQMRHVFMRQDISAKEARLLDLLSHGKTWKEVARELGYKTSKIAANVGDRIFDKLITPEDEKRIASEGIKKRHLALEIWQARRA